MGERRLEVHRLRHVEWLPTAVVALSTSADGTAIAVARESGAIEVWKAAPGSVGWYSQLVIPGMQGSAISSLMWCHSESSPLGRLFSAGLDGRIIEWDLQTLQPKCQAESFGGSIWQITARPVRQTPVRTLQKQNEAKGNESESEESDSEDEDSTDSTTTAAQQQDVAVACDDGSVRLFTVTDTISYKKAFPRVKGRILSVAWSFDASRVFAGDSDGCIRCWDPESLREMYRITVGIGGTKRSNELCVWSLLALKNGTLVSGDSTGSTQFWDSQGTLLDSHNRHDADVLTLTAAPSHGTVFAGGADGQVIVYKLVHSSKRLETSKEEWTFIGSKRAHTHDVRALTVAVPIPIDEGDPTSKPWSRPYKDRKKFAEPDHRKWAKPGIPMVVSGGNDAKLFAYPADDMKSYQPHDICPAPERTFVQLVADPAKQESLVMLAQHSTYIDIWRVSGMHSTCMNGNGHGLGKRKRDEPVSNGTHKRLSPSPDANGADQLNYTKSGHRPVLLAKIKSKSSAHICCSAISPDGRHLAFSDTTRPRLFELEHSEKQWIIKKKSLHPNLPLAHRLVFSVDSRRLMLASPENEILVLDLESRDVLHVFKLDKSTSSHPSPVTLLCVSPDGQWLAAGTSSGILVVFSLDTLKHHWSVPLIDGTPATAAVFHPGHTSVLFVTTAANKIHVLDLEARDLGDWSKMNYSNMPSEILEFPGGITGLTVSASHESTKIIAYSSRAMCMIDFSKPVEAEQANTENGRAVKKMRRNIVFTPFKHPVLFVEYLSKESLFVVERPWLEVLQRLPAPVFRHRYGT